MTPTRSALIVIPILLILALAWLVWFGDGAAPAAVVSPQADAGQTAPQLDAGGTGSGALSGEARRTSADEGRAGSDAADAADAAYAAALSGFKGRIVDEQRQPQAGSLVRLYRLDPEVLQFEGLFAETDDAPDSDPEAASVTRLQIHEATTGDDGRFAIAGAWPHAFYILEADALGENRLTVPVDRLPGPGEVVDLGDIVLKRLGVIVGRVVDEAGAGLQGVTVRAQDVPGTFLDLAPVERFDPDGAVLIREGEKPMVIEMPGFVRRYYDMLMKPITVTLPDGRFRLAGVQPADNVMAFNRRGYVPTTLKSVRVKAGEEKDVGVVELGEGEIVYVKVIDGDDKPVAGAEVLVAATTTLFPADFATRAGSTDAKGQLQHSGLPKGRVTVAARRSRSHPWVCSQPVSINADVVVRLPSRHHFDLSIKSAAGQAIVRPDFKLMPALDGGVPLDFGVLGFVKWLDIKDKTDKLEDGRYRISDLIPGKYTLAVVAAGHAAAKLDFKISTSAAGEITLRPESRFTVLVVDADGVPVRRAKIYVQCPRPEQGGRLLEMPILAGQTDGRGQLVVKQGEVGKLRVSASHPAYGLAHAESTLPSDQPIVLTMESPGELLGRLTEGGRPPLPGKWTIVIEPRGRGRRTRGAMPDLPKLTVAGLDGNFRAQGLRPGDYTLRVIKSVSAVTSPGGMIGFLMQARMMHDNTTLDVVLESGQPTYVELDAIKPPAAIDGPSARVTGTVFVDGRPGAEMMITGRGKRRHGVTADKSGRFDLGLVPAGPLRVSVHDPKQSTVLDMRMDGHLWQRSVEIKGGEDLVLDIDLATGRIVGRVSIDGAPAKMVKVKASGMVPQTKVAPSRSSMAFTLTDESGRFEFDSLPAGQYSLEVNDRRQGYGVAGGLAVLPGSLVSGVAIGLGAVHSVSGKVDLASVSGDQPPRWAYLRFRQAGGGGKEQSARVVRGGEFRARGIPPGSYEVQIFVADESGRPREFVARERVTVVDQDVRGVVLSPMVEPTGNKK